MNPVSPGVLHEPTSHSRLHQIAEGIPITAIPMTAPQIAFRRRPVLISARRT